MGLPAGVADKMAHALSNRCWASTLVPPYAACDLVTTSDLGLCPAHEAEMVGPA
jgi:hypothetical protein